MIRDLDQNPRTIQIIGAGAVLLLLVTLLRNAWLTDDCYITFRTIWNLWQGHGLCWNVIERVQTYTHPLWLFVLTPIYGITGKAWLTAWVAGIGFTLAAATVIFRSARTPVLGLAGLVLLLSSRAFIDFGTSGLENPLSWLLLVLFVGVVTRDQPPASPLVIGLLSSLLLLNRLDHLFFVLPALLILFLRLDGRGRRQLMWGALPLVLWLVFSTVYYGSPLPNTFFAKAQTGFPPTVMLAQGLRYFLDSIVNDFVTLPIILLGAALPLHKQHRYLWPLALGLLAKVVYVLLVGGDFMTGRFFADPFVWAVALLLQWKGRTNFVIPGAMVVFLIALLHPYHPHRISADYYQDRTGRERALFPAGIVDEKGMAWKRSSLHAFDEAKEVVGFETRLAEQPTVFDPQSLLVQIHVAVGARGYTCGPNVHIIDRLGITDPLLARLPARDDFPWRIGHFFRWVPYGYPQSILQGENRVGDPSLRSFYDDVVLVTRGPIWSVKRWKAIVRLNLGWSDEEIDEQFYRTPPADALEGSLGPMTIP